jgi:hypothetical protein
MRFFSSIGLTAVAISSLGAAVAKDDSLDFLSSGHSVLTPSEMLALPRPSGLVPSPHGDVGVEIVSEHDFKTRK